MNLLFVCSGNISRSFLAEALLRAELRRFGLKDVDVRSAGLHAFPGNGPDPEMVRFLLERGVPVPDHEARSLSRDDAAWADWILVMERGHLGAVTSMFPEARDKVELLGRYIPGSPTPDDIGDPFGRSSYHYRLAQARIGTAVQGLLARLRCLGEGTPVC